MRAGHYIVVTHSQRPAPGQRTETKNWGKNALWETVEEVEFVSRIKKRHMDTSAMVIDYTKKAFIKNRMDHLSFEQVIGHIREKYPQQFNTFTNLVKESEK